MEPTLDDLLATLHGLVGREVHLDGVPCQVVEILVEQHAIVLRDLNAGKVIQPNQHGDPQRRVDRTFTVPVMSPLDDELHPVLSALIEEEAERERLLALARGVRG